MSWSVTAKRWITGFFVWPAATWWVWRNPKSSRPLRVATAVIGVAWVALVLGMLAGDTSPPKTNLTAAGRTESSTATATATPSPTPDPESVARLAVCDATQTAMRGALQSPSFAIGADPCAFMKFNKTAGTDSQKGLDR